MKNKLLQTNKLLSNVQSSSTGLVLSYLMLGLTDLAFLLGSATYLLEFILFLSGGSRDSLLIIYCAFDQSAMQEQKQQLTHCHQLTHWGARKRRICKFVCRQKQITRHFV